MPRTSRGNAGLSPPRKEQEATTACAKATHTIHCRNPRAQALRNMLEHLIDYEPPICDAAVPRTPMDKAAPSALLDAQVATADWLSELGAPSTDEASKQAAQAAAHTAFGSLIKGASAANQREALIKLKTPAAVRHLTGMLTAYDWEFVEQAKEIRGYAVSQIMEETKNPDARIRLRALELLGRVTEVALFTDRVEVKKSEVSDTELDAKIKEKLARFAGVVDIPASQVTDVTPTDTQ